MNYLKVRELARDFRKNPTTAEKFFWNKVRNNKFHGIKFYRQYIIEHAEILGRKYFYIADFYVHTNRTIIEIDGKIHEDQIEYDKMREEILIEMGYKIIRFSNEEVIYQWSEVEDRLLKIFGLTHPRPRLSKKTPSRYIPKR